MNDTINRIITPPTSILLDELEERERAVALFSFLPEIKHLTIYCSRTGVPVATLDLIQQAGRIPYLSNWKDSQAFHPLFSLPQAQLLSWTRKNWNSLFRGQTTDQTSHVQKEQFCIAFMAILHSLKCIDQQCPALPEFDTVNSTMQRLLELAYWYNYLDSKRFRFPTLRINKLNANHNLKDIGTYFDICDSVRHDWETSKDANIEDTKLEAARRAEKAVRSSHVRAVSKKALWNWFLSSLASANSKRYSLPEWKEWKEDSAKLFFANENQQLQYSVDDVDMIEEVFIRECTLGTTVSHAFTTELHKIRERISNHNTIFTIDWESVGRSKTRVVQNDGVETPVIKKPEAPAIPGPEPKLGEFSKRVDYIRAKAKWDIAVKQYNAWKEKHPQEEHPQESGGEHEDNHDDEGELE